MASGYMYEEALDIYTKYFALFPSTLVTKFGIGKKNKQNAGELLQGWAKPKTLGRSKGLHIHNYATHNMTTTQPLLR
jgi:hypothetical protein